MSITCSESSVETLEKDVCSYFTLFSTVSIVEFEHASVSWAPFLRLVIFLFKLLPLSFKAMSF